MRPQSGPRQIKAQRRVKSFGITQIQEGQQRRQQKAGLVQLRREQRAKQVETIELEELISLRHHLQRSGIIVKERLFLSTYDLRAVGQRILHRSHRVLEEGEYDFMLCHFVRHPDFYLKNLFDVVSIFVSSAPYPYGDYDCFWLMRQNGQTIDISYNKAVFAEATNMQRFMAAAREALRENFDAFVEQEWVDGLTCAVCSKTLTKEEAIVEHYPLPLERLMLQFLKEMDVNLDYIEYQDIGEFVDNQFYTGVWTTYVFKSQELINILLDWHAENAEMRIISLEVYVYQPSVWQQRISTGDMGTEAEPQLPEQTESDEDWPDDADEDWEF